MLFAHGLDYKAALTDYVKLSGRIAMMDFEAYGVWYSKYYKPGATEKAYRQVIAKYKQLELPLNVLVMDVGWHMEENHPERRDCKGYGGYTWNRTLFKNPKAYTKYLHDEEHMRLLVNTHDYTGVDSCQDFYPAMAKQLGVDPATHAILPCAWSNKSWVNAVYTQALDARQSGNVSSIDWLCTT